MVNPLGHWIFVPFCTSSWIPLRGLSGSWVIVFRIPLRGLSVFWVPPGLVVTVHPLPVPVFWYFEFLFFVVGLTYLGLITLWCHIVWCFLTQSARFYFPLPRICGNGFVGFCVWPNKISCLLLGIFFALSFRWLCYLPLYCLLLPVWVVVGVPYLLGPSS